MNRIKEIRLHQNMLQKDIESMLNIGRGTLSNYENEKRSLNPDLINRLCDIFGCTADYLLCRSDDPSPLISAEDLRLLQAYRAAPEHIRTALAAMLQLDEKETPAAQKERAAG